MGVLKSILGSVKVLQHDVVDAVDLTLAASWADATDIGDLKGKPFVKVAWDQNSVETQRGKVALEITAKIETSSLDVTTAQTLTDLQEMRGLNVSLLCTPVGTVGAENPIIILPNYRLHISGELNVGDISSIKLHSEKPAYDEAEVYTLLDAALGAGS
jgi:hypothetical protein